MKDVPVLINPYFQEFTIGSWPDKNLIPVQEVHDNGIAISMSYRLVGEAVPMRTVLNHIGNVSYQITSCQRLLPIVFPVCSYLPLICLTKTGQLTRQAHESVFTFLSIATPALPLVASPLLELNTIQTRALTSPP